MPRVPIFLQPYLKYATFTGRASRPEFWGFCLFILCVDLIGAMFEFLGGGHHAVTVPTAVGKLILVLVSLVSVVPLLAVAVRRLHDLGRSAPWLLLICIPFLGPFVFLAMMAPRGMLAENRFGPAPGAP